MKLKKIVAESLQEGWVKIYKEFGENAIIVSVNEVDGKFEIVVAANKASDNKPPQDAKSLLENIKHSFEKEENLEGLEGILELLLKLKDLSVKDRKFASKFINSHFEGFSQINGKLELIQSKTKTEKLQKRFINILGGTATGKTTTAVKLAAILKFTEGKNVAVASFDYFKVGAFEMVKRFCDIMQVPFFPIKSKKDIISYKDDFDRYDYVIFDTPGNLSKLPDTKEIVKYISESENSENILTISLDKKETLIKKEVEEFSYYNIDSVILTKFDEVSFEEFLMTLANIPYEVSFITNGSNIPNDILDMSDVVSKVEV